MGLSEDVDDILQKHQELCRNLNLDLDSANQAWSSYETIRQNYTLEGDQLHWLGCALYVACRRVTTPSVGHSENFVQGNGVNLTRLLRLCNLSLIQFFNKSKKWVNMANMPIEFNNEIERLERSFEVSTVTFKQYQLIFYDMFLNSMEDTPRQQRSRKQRSVPCTTAKVFEFCWTLFIYMKGENPEISTDLVNSYHYLLACCDLMFGNAVMADRRDLLKPDFPGLPSNWSSSNYVLPEEPPCVIDALCKRHEADVLEAKVIKNYSWRDYMQKLIDKKIIRAQAPIFSGLLDQEVFDVNLRSINREYETYVLNKGDFDERIFLAECRRMRILRTQYSAAKFILRPALQELRPEDDANIHIGSPARLIDGDINEQLNLKKSRVGDEGLENQSVPDTPYTGRSYLRGRREVPAGSTLVTTATCSVSHLRTLLSGRTSNPSSELLDIFKRCENNPCEKIRCKLDEYGRLFVSKYPTNEENVLLCTNIANERLELAKTLFYKLLEDIITDEKRKKSDMDCSNNIPHIFVGLLNQDIFHHCLFAICLEIVIFSYTSQRTFPWVLETLNLDAYYFYRIIEPVVSIRDHLSRDLVKHLNSIEEQILQSMAWKSDSPIWEKIVESDLPVPNSVDCTVPAAVNNIRKDQNTITDGESRTVIQTDSQINGNVPSSPILQSSTAERFQSPVTTTYMAKKRLLQDSPSPALPSRTTIKPGQSLLQNQTKMFLSIGGDKLIPVVIQPKVAATASSQNENQCQNTDNTTLNSININTPKSPISQPVQQQSQTERKAKRGGSLALFFRKFYHLASVRMSVLCNDLNLANAELRLKIWTCFEYSIVNHTELMKDRHLDQILMCAVYVVCKVGGRETERTFTEIMRCYRLQPQASSHVYRSVLLHSRCTDNNSTDDDIDTPQQKQNEPSAGQIAPLTPNQLAGTATSYPNELRGDLIKFYNTIYIQKTQQFALRFSNTAQSQNLLLSPLPSKPLTASPTRRVSDKVYVRSLTKSTVNQSPANDPLVYCFSRSPAKDLRAINNMINFSKLGKRRILNDDSVDTTDATPAKQVAGDVVQRRIHGLFNDRLEQSKEKE